MRVSLTMAGALALMLGAMAVVQGSRSGDEAKTSPERQTAELLDSLIQPRFQVTNGTNFGMSRIAPRIQGHGHIGAIKPENDTDKQALAQVGQLGCDYRLGFIHTGYNLSRFGAKATAQKTPHFTMIWHDVADYNAHKGENLALFSERILPTVGRLEKGAKIDTQQGEWQVFLRPVKAEKETCVSCHAGIKPGQTMGAMVYLVKNAGH